MSSRKIINTGVVVVLGRFGKSLYYKVYTQNLTLFDPNIEGTMTNEYGGRIESFQRGLFITPHVWAHSLMVTIYEPFMDTRSIKILHNVKIWGEGITRWRGGEGVLEDRNDYKRICNKGLS